MIEEINYLKVLGSSMTRILFTTILVFSLTIVSNVAHAQSDAPAAPAPAKGDKVQTQAGKRTSINFEDQLIEGQAQKPELFYLLQQRNNNFKRLIRLRENFLPEMRKSSEDAARSTGKGSGN